MHIRFLQATLPRVIYDPSITLLIAYATSYHRFLNINSYVDTNCSHMHEVEIKWSTAAILAIQRRYVNTC